MSDTICLYHANCADGIASAWAVWKRFPDWEFRPMDYHEAEKLDFSLFEGRHVVMVDFSMKERHVTRIVEAGALSVLILDHHKTALAELGYLRSRMLADGATWDDWQKIRDYPHRQVDLSGTGIQTPLRVLFDMDRSGAMIAWEFFHPDAAPPRMIDLVQDRDLWRFQEHGSRELHEVIALEAVGRVDGIQRFEDLTGRLPAAMHHEGEMLLSLRSRDITKVMPFTREANLGAFAVVAANCMPWMASEFGHAICDNGPDRTTAIACLYWDEHGHRKFSLRSADEGPDVSEIAKGYGGGGHKHAAGFTVTFDRLGPDGMPRSPMSAQEAAHGGA